MIAWHWIRDDKKTRYDERPIRVGRWMKAHGEIEMCQNGMHGSKRILDALHFAPGPIVCRVEIDGEIECGSDKIVGRRRKVIWMLDATNTLHEFACRCAEDALALIKNPDPRTIAAIEAKRKWVRGEITDQDLAAARNAAWDAWAAAGDAARAAGDAARAAGDAARDAARAAARNATWDAWAAWDAAWNAAGDAAWAKMNRRLTAMVVAEHENKISQR